MAAVTPERAALLQECWQRVREDLPSVTNVMATNIVRDLDVGPDGNLLANLAQTIENLTRQIIGALAIPAEMLMPRMTTTPEIEQQMAVERPRLDSIDQLAVSCGLGDWSLFVLQTLEWCQWCQGHEEHVIFQEVFAAMVPADRGPLVISITSPTPLGIAPLDGPHETISWPRVAQLMRMPDARWEVEQRPGMQEQMMREVRVASRYRPSPDREAAAARSIALLKEWLMPAQREQYERDGCFDVIGGDTGYRYRIRKPGPYNILCLARGANPPVKICVEPAGASAPGDVMLAQKIALETNEYATIEVANIAPIDAVGGGGGAAEIHCCGGGGGGAGGHAGANGGTGTTICGSGNSTGNGSVGGIWPRWPLVREADRILSDRDII